MPTLCNSSAYKGAALPTHCYTTYLCRCNYIQPFTYICTYTCTLASFASSW
jgi:hypothetical protein